MELLEYRVKVPVKDARKSWHIYFNGDWHLGAKACDEKLLKDTLQGIARDPRGLYVGMGDFGEAIVPGDVRFDPRAIAPHYLPELEDIAGAQFKDIEKLLTPLANQGKIMGLFDGNHEDTIRLKHYRHLVLDLARTLNTNYLGYSAYIRLAFEKISEEGKHCGTSMFIINAAHGNQASRTKGAILNRGIQAIAYWDTDIYVRGHSHHIIHQSITKMKMTRQGKPKMREYTPVIGASGCYFKTYQEGCENYGEKADFPPSDLGCVRVVIKPFKDDIGELSIEKYLP